MPRRGERAEVVFGAGYGAWEDSASAYDRSGCQTTAPQVVGRLHRLVYGVVATIAVAVAIAGVGWMIQSSKAKSPNASEHADRSLSSLESLDSQRKTFLPVRVEKNTINVQKIEWKPRN